MVDVLTSAGRDYVFAVVFTGAAVAVSWLVDPWVGERLALVTLPAAVAASVWLGGYRPAVIAAVLGYAACASLFRAPSADFPAASDVFGLAAYGVSSAVIIGFGEAMRRARMRARHRQAFLWVTLASIGDGVITTDTEGRVTYLNGVAASLTGWSHPEAAGRPLDAVFRIVNEQTRQTVENPATRALREGAVMGLANHTVLVARDGTERPIDDSAAPIRDENGRVVGCVLVFRDVTERRRAERALQRSERELADFFENASVGLHRVGPDGIVLRVNRAELDLLGYGEAEYVGRPIAQFHADQPVIEDILARLARGETVRDRPARMRCRDGSIRDVLVSSNALFEEGRLVHTRCFTVDVTDRKRAEEAGALLASIVAASDDAIVSKTLDGTILSWNAGAERLFGYTPAEAVGRPIGLIIPPELQEEERSILARLRRGERVDHFETVRVTKHGGRVDVSLTISPIHDDAGRIVGASKIARDVTARRRVEDNRRESERRFRLMADAAPVMIWIAGTDKLCTWFNRQWLEFVGRPIELELGNGWAENVHPDDLDRLLRTYAAAFDARQPYSMEYRLRRHDGEHRYVLVTGTPLYDAGREFTGYIGSCIDITERTRAEQALRESEERFARFMQNLPGLAWIKDLEGRYVFANDAALKAFRFPRAQLYGRTDEDVFPPEVAASFVENDRRALANGTGVQVVEVLEHDDGTLHQSIVSKFPIRGPDGEATWVGGMAIDVTDRKRAEDALRDSESRLRAVFDAAVDGIITINESGLIESVNPAVERLFGYSAAELVGRNVSVLMPDPYRSEHDSYLESYRRTGQRRIIGIGREVRGLRKDGTEFPMDLSVSELRLGGQRMFTGLVRDVTERKRAEEALREADRRKTEFLATLAHELRNPLAPIRNSLEIMKLAENEPEALRQGRETIERQLGSMVRLVDDLLDVSRITRDALELRRTRVELDSVVHHALETCRDQARRQSQKVEVALPEPPVYLDADPVRLAQVFSNLLNNACKYTPPGGRILVTGERRDGNVVVTVKDSGVGIPPDKLESIFEMFAQLGAAGERSRVGLGIGLTLVKRLVELHGGSVEARSPGPGRGSEFVVRLPILVDKPEDQEETVPAAIKPASAPLRVLVVDDNEDSAQSLAKLLSFGGHETRMAYDGLETVDAAEQFRPDVVLLDIGLPKLSGLDACRRIREQPWGGSMVMIALTGWGQDGDRDRSRDAGFDGHLVKPVDHGALMQLLGSLLTERGGRSGV